MRDFAFSPREVTVVAGQSVTLRVSNRGATRHSLTIQEMSVDQVVEPGKTINVLLQAPEAGEAPFACRFHPRMRGVLRVTG